MSRKFNIVGNVLTFVFTLGLMLSVVLIGNSIYGQMDIKYILLFLAGAILAGFISTALHELGHLIFGIKNGFCFISISVLFFKWEKYGKKVKFSFTLFNNEAGSTEMVPKYSENMDRRFKSMTFGGIIFSFIPVIVGTAFLFFGSFISATVYCLFSMFLPIGIYCLLDNAFPMSSYNVRNDGAVIYGINKKDDESKVMLSLLCWQAEMYKGKTPSMAEEFLKDLPQLPEDNPYFTLLLNARYNVCLDKEDFIEAKKISSRLYSLKDDLVKPLRNVVLADVLYGFCTFNFDDKKADDITYDIEKYLNNENSVTNLRIKLAYILYVEGEKNQLDMFYKKAIKEANKCQISGFGTFEKKLIEKMKSDFDK